MVEASSSSTPTRPQAGPLPPKIGELTYVPPVDQEHNTDVTPSATDAADMALRPHPAESTAHLPITTPNPSPPSLREAHDTASIHSKKSFVRLLLRGDPSKPMPTFQGVRLATLLRVVFILLAIIGTIVGWALTFVVINRHNAQRAKSPDPSNSNPSLGTSNQSTIFIHVAFGLITILLLVFLERAVFLARAERYRYVHDLGTSSRSRDATGRSVDPTTMAFAPWNRPSLPTYANALGFRGTGDVEDAAIAAPPPPEYGNTRGSTLLLSTMLQRASLRGRPVSYTSQVEVASPAESNDEDEDAEASDARKARRLEESLAALERETPEVSVPAPAVVRH